MPTSEVIGRDRELGALDAFLAAASAGPAALVLTGEPGIGKTLLWEAGVARARRLGHRVLIHRSVEAEAGFAFAGLADLMGPVLGEVADQLAAPRRRALEVALLLTDAGEAPPEPHAIGLALLDVLGALARDGPVVLALDDLQWLDASSASVIPAALRRLGTERAGLLATARGDEPPWLKVASNARSLPVGPLDLAMMHRLFQERLGVEFSRPQLARIHEISGGNPFFALELGRASAAPGGEVRVPRSLGELLGGRVEGLPDAVSDVLLTAAALARPTIRTVTAVNRDARTALGALQTAASAGVIELDDDRVRFVHPLLASLCYERAPVWRRRDVHRKLAATVTDVEERARHLALSTDGPDAAVAAELDQAVAHAARRGAASTAADLAELAAIRTAPTDMDERGRRRLKAGRLHWLAGDIERATTIYNELITDLPPGLHRADVLYALAATGKEDIPARVRLCSQALREAGDDDTRAVEILSHLSVLRWLAGDVNAALASARDGLARAGRLGDLRWVAISQARLAWIGSFGLERTPGLIEEAVEIERSLDEPIPFYRSPSWMLAQCLLDDDRPHDAKRLLEKFADAALATGAEHTLQFAFSLLSTAERRIGIWDRARTHAEAVLEFAAQAHDPEYRGIAGHVNAFMDADLGKLTRARDLARMGLARTLAIRDEIFGIANLAALGHAELVAGDPEAAMTHLRELPARMLRSGHHGGVASCTWPDTIEGLVATGELELARTHLQDYESIAARANRLMRIGASRCRGFLAAAHGDTAAALAAFADSLSHDEPPLYPFERARTLLAMGATRRTALQRRAARETLEQALAIFEQLGARPWAAKTRDELQRVSGRGPATSELTEGERRVAELAADGRQNKEIAAALYIGVGTVEAHLSRVYRKLGIRSRTELAARFARQESESSKV